jgi:nitroreductase
MKNLNLVQAIDRRTSKRIFKKQPVPSDLLNEISLLINKYNNESKLNLQIIDNAEKAFKSFLISYGKFKGIKNAIALVANKEVENYLEKVGFFGEQLLLRIVTMGLDTCWVGVNFNRKADVFKLDENEELVAVIVFGFAEDLPTKFEDDKYGITHRSTITIEAMTTNDQILPHNVEEGIVAILKAPSAKNKQPVKVEYKNKLLRLMVDPKPVENLVELGIAKAHYCIVNGGRFEWGNGQVYKL